MLRVLACIPHFFRRRAADSGIANGSNFDTLESRLEQFRYCLKQLTAVLEPDRFLMGSPGRIAHEQVEPVPQSIAGEIMVVTVLNRPGFVGGSNFQIGWSRYEQDDEQILP